jgi:hypothetical protein
MLAAVVRPKRGAQGAKRTRAASISSRMDSSTEDDDSEPEHSSPTKKNRTAAGGGSSSQGEYLNTLYYSDTTCNVSCCTDLTRTWTIYHVGICHDREAFACAQTTTL